ncbi:MAG: HDIG domain-containing protein [candidate division Zixibacteria bacterium]|nr:HDIG domain-containing protein [candidate division Zixibacteria bacterium]
MDVEKYFPEIKEINNDELRAKVERVWNKALEMSGWSEEELEFIPFSLLTKDSGVNLMNHTRAVTRTAIETARIIKESYGDKVDIDFDILIAGGLLHDVGKLLEYQKFGNDFVKSPGGKLVRHPFSGTSIAFSEGLPVEVQHMIATHAHEGDGGFRSVEAIIINHADFVNFESLGGKI